MVGAVGAVWPGPWTRESARAKDGGGDLPNQPFFLDTYFRFPTQDLRPRGLDIQEREVADIFRQDERSRERETHSRQTTLLIKYDLGVHSKFA